MIRRSRSLVLRTSTRELLADKILDLANLSIAALVFGNFISEKGFDSVTAIMGVAITLALYVWAFVVSQRGEQ